MLTFTAGSFRIFTRYDSHSVIKPARIAVTRVLHNVPDKVKVSMAFRCRVNCRHGTDRRTACNTLSPW